MPDSEPPRPSTGSEVSTVLADVLSDQADRQRRRRGRARPPAPRGGAAWIVVAVGAMLTVRVWTSAPAAVSPPPLPAPSPVDVEAGLRMDLYVTVLRVQAFRDSVGRLPASLDEVMADPAEADGVLYEPLGGGVFRVGGARGDAAVSWRSDRPLTELLRDAPDHVRGGGR